MTGCTFWPRCDRTPTVDVDDRERYCRRHAIWVADKETRTAVLARDGGKCRKCGAEGNSLDWAHIVTRSAPFIRWSMDPPNSVALCRPCHMRFTNQPKVWAAAIVDWYGFDHYNLLRRRELIAERKGGQVDLAEVIRGARASLLTPGEALRYEGGRW
jgi:hypothetical protein